MKNFTNNFKQFTSRLSARWLILALMLLLGTSSVWGWDISGGDIYFNNSETKWSDASIQFVIGKNDYSSTYEMTKITNTNLCYYSLPKWEGSTYYGIIGTGSKWGNGNWGPNNLTNAAHYTAAYTSEYKLNSGSSYYLTPSSANNGCTMTITYKGTSYTTIPTYTATLAVETRPGTSGTYSSISSNAPATLKLQGTVLSGYGTSSRTATGASEVTWSTTKTRTAVVTGLVTVSYSNLSAGYTFDGWYEGSTKISTATSYSYNQSANTTITARFTQSCTPPDKPDFGSESSAEYCYGDPVSFPTIDGVTLKWYDEETGGNVVESPETNVGSTIYYAAAVEECESTERTQYTITIKTKPTVTLKPNENTVCTDVTLGDITDYVKIESTNGSQISWYAAAQGGDALATSTPLMETSYFAEATFNGCSSDRAEFTITDVLSAPTEVPNVTAPETICDGESAVLELNNKGANYTYSVNGEEVDFTNNEYTVYPTSTTDYTVSVENKCGSLSTTKTIAVNPLPTITSISASNDEPVPFEDVVLTATGVTQGAEVKWYLDNDETPVATGTTYVVTSENAVDVIVKAKAFLNGCESATTKTVIFSAENCADVPSNDIQITFVHPAPASNTKGQWWGLGSLYYSTDNGSTYTQHTGEEISCDHDTGDSYTITLKDLSVSSIKVYFKACYDYGYDSAADKKATTENSPLTLNKGNAYTIIISEHGNEDINATAEISSTGSLTQNPEIKAPAVKMISAEYDEENDVIVAKGAVYKTGCGETFWGFQYSEDGQKWGTADADFIRPSTGNSLSVPGEFDYSFPILDANGGETYYIRAYALNNYNNDDYSLSSAVYSATSLPVEIPSKTINSATISLVDSEGKESDVTEVCPQSTVYLKVSYVGGDFTDFVAEENFPGTDLELVNHDKTNNYAIFSFTATAAGIANITISNTSGSTVTPAKGVSITLKDVQVVTPPIITINPESAMICQGDDATISIVEANQIFTYTIYKDGEALNPQSFTITEAGVYTVGATENECKTSATSMPIELKVVSSDVKIGLEADNTSIGPWQPLKLTVTPAKGYEYTLEGLDGMVYTKEGDVYTIKIPRPNDWSPGNSGTQLETENKVFTAKIKVSDEVSCGSKEVTVTLTDTEENCE